MKMSQKTFLTISAVLWLVIGVTLLSFGGFLLLKKALHGKIIRAVILMLFSVLWMRYKGRFVVDSVVSQSFQKIQAFANPAPFTSLFTKENCMVIAGFLLLGLVMKVIGVPLM